MFRKLYWVTEHVDADGHSCVAGVYTSIPDLVRHGLKHPSQSQLRLSLTKLDHEGLPLGTWSSPDFSGLEADLAPYVKTDEFTADQCAALLAAVRQPAHSAAA